jgi:hypothetical protein
MRRAALAIFLSMTTCSVAKDPPHVYLAKAIEPSSARRDIVSGRAATPPPPPAEKFLMLQGCSPFTTDRDPRETNASIHCEPDSPHHYECWGPAGPSAFDGKPHR